MAKGQVKFTIEKEDTMEQKNSLEREPIMDQNTVDSLLNIHRQKKEVGETSPLSVELIEFAGLEEGETIGSVTKPVETRTKDEFAAQIDHYNPSRLFTIEGKKVAAFREEPRGSEKDSKIKFYEQTKDSSWQSIEGAPVLEGYQDPFYLGEIQGQNIFGAVKIYEKEDDSIGYKTDFFKFKKSLSEIEKFAEGPDMMKDIRLVDRKNGKIGVFVRPQKGENNRYGRGKVGYLEVENLDQLQESLMNFEDKAKIFDNLFATDEWGGINDLHLLKNAKIGVIGHIARFAKDENGQETDQKEYYAITALFVPENQEITNMQVFMTEEDLEEKIGIHFPHKTPKLKSVLFPGGSVRQDDGTLQIYVGVGDTKAVSFIIKDPFLEYEKGFEEEKIAA